MKAVVLAGGEGTRLRPLTSTRPKPLMPIADRPCIDYLIRSIVNCGIKKIIIATHYLSDKLIKAIGDGLNYDASILYSFEEKPAGTAGAVKRIEGFLDDTFVVIMGDIVADVDLAPLIDFHKDKNSAATIALTEVDDPTQYGVAAINEKGKILRFQEKPKKSEAFSNLVNAGIYVLEKRVIEFVPENKMFDFSKNLFPLLLSKSIPVFGTPVSGTWMDIGRPSDLLKAGLEMVKKRGSEITIPNVETTGKLLVGEGVSISKAVKIEGPCYIGAKVKIGNGATIKGSCLYDEVIVGANTVISDTLVLESTGIGAKSEIVNSIVAGGCEIAESVRMFSSVVGDGVSIKPNTSLQNAVLP